VLEICKRLSQLKHNMPASFFLYGERGIGKTALAKLVKSVAASNNPELYGLNLLTSYYSIEQGQELNSVLQNSLNKLTDQMDSSLVSKVGERLGDLFSNGKFKIGAFGVSAGLDLATTKSNQEITIKDQTTSILENILKANAEQEMPKDGLLIIIDELNHLADLDSAASVIRNISTTLDVDGFAKVSFLLIGYEEDEEKFFSKDSSAKRMFDLYKLDVMPSDDAKLVLTKGFVAANLEWDVEALSLNIGTAGGYPHAIQRLGNNLVEVDSDQNISAEDWHNAIFKTANDLQTKEFATMFSFGKAQTTRDKVLVALATSGDPLNRQELKERTGNTNVSQDISKLKKVGAIRENDKKQISLHSQLFRTAILFDHFSREPNQESLPFS
jgi:hypothetical protein